MGSQGQSSGDLTAPGDATGCQYCCLAGAGFDHLGNQYHGGNLPGVAAGFGALGDDHFDACFQMARGMFGLTAHRTDHDVFLAQQSHHIGRRRAQCTDDHPDLRVFKRHLNQAPCTLRGHAAAAFDDFARDALTLARGQ